MNRYIDIKGGYNIRDIGGYKTLDGGTIRWGKIFRAGLLTHIKDENDPLMISMNLKSICDFRSNEEQSNSPDCWYQLDQLRRYSLPISDGRQDKFPWLKDELLEIGEGHHLYKANQSYVLQHSDKYRRFFELLLNVDNYPILFHCTAGKDRTGFATILLLSALGVDWNTIVEDYLLTNIYLAEFGEKISEMIAQKSTVPKEKIVTIFQANEIYLKGALVAIREQYGSIDQYMIEALGVGNEEISLLRHILIE